MKSCKNKFILLLASLLTCATIFTFVGCAGNGGRTIDDIIDDCIVDEDYVGAGIDEPAWTAISYEITLNDIDYNIVYRPEGAKIDEFVGYMVNCEDYEYFYEKDPDAVYFISETNSVLNEGYYHNSFSVYTIKGYNFEQCVALCSGECIEAVYININYDGGD